MSYSNITLTSLGGDLQVVVYLPNGIKAKEEPFYASSRFDHGSMIGSVTRKRNSKDPHVLYGTSTWRVPHNSHWPESGVGLASEFGVGDDGALCLFRCGWPLASEVTNGVLGYQEAANGHSFLKIGVGELVKGTCPACDSTDDYRFNSPYHFASDPVWKLTRLNKNSNNQNNAVQLQHQATLRNYGYKLTKDIDLADNVLSVTMTLQNLGAQPFSTVWYSHHFFTCDGNAVGPGYELEMDLKSDGSEPLYEEPSAWTWSTPLAQYGTVSTDSGHVALEMKRAIEPGTRIKAEFVDDEATKGAFTINSCDSSIKATLESPMGIRSALDDSGTLSMYAYNLYLERGTFSPEPQLLIRNLAPNHVATWTLKLRFEDLPEETDEITTDLLGLRSVALESRPWSVSATPTGSAPFAGFFVVCCLVFLLVKSTWTRYDRRRRDYDLIQ